MLRQDFRVEGQNLVVGILGHLLVNITAKLTDRLATVVTVGNSKRGIGAHGTLNQGRISTR